MTAQNPSTIISDPTWRILTREGWGGDVEGYTTLSTWTELPMRSATSTGYSVVEIGLSTVDEITEARFDYEYGRINDKIYSQPGEAGQTIVTWDPSTNTLNVPDLAGRNVIIQRLARTETGGGNVEEFWVTAFAGVVVRVNDAGFAASETPQGTVTYIAKDFMRLLDDWRMNRHVLYYTSSEVYPTAVDGGNPGCPGHPGYNTIGEGRILGNKQEDVLGIGYLSHTPAGSGDLWTDKEMIEHALASSEKPGDQPLVTLAGDWTTFEKTSSVQDVSRNESVARFIRRVCDRRRAKGSVVLSPVGDGDTTTPDTKIRMQLVAYPQFFDDVEYTLPSGATATIPGASSNGTSINLDFINDHRCGPNTQSTFSFDEDSTNQYDRVETIGQRLRVATTLSFADESLEEAWEQSEETAYLAAGNTVSANEGRYAHVFRQVRLPVFWDWQVGNVTEVGSESNHRIDLYCDDDGYIIRPLTTDAITASWLECQILPITSFYYGYNYTGASPEKYESSIPSNDPSGIPIWLLTASTNLDGYYRNDAALGNITIRPFGSDGRTYEIIGSESEFGTERSLESPDGAVALTCTLRLPSRLQFATNAVGFGGEGQPSPRTVKQIFAPEFGLHILDGYCIHSLDSTDESGTSYFAAQRGGCQGDALAGDAANIGITRDDRDSLYGIHQMACQWYLTKRAAIQFTMYDCLIALESYDVWPKPGMVVGSVVMNGRTRDVKTPVTKVAWDRKDNKTRFWTAWGEYDYR